MVIICVTLFGVCVVRVHAQESSSAPKDSLRVLVAEPVEIEGQGEDGFQKGRFSESIPITTLHHFSAEPILSEAIALIGEGIDVKRYSSLGGVAFTSIHGLPSEYTIIYRDGIRVTNEQNSLTDLGRTSSYSISSIDFLTPPASVLLGGDAIGASLNLISRHASLTPQFEIGGSALAYEQSRIPSEQDYYGKADFTLSGRAGVSLTASNEHSDGAFPFLQSSTNTSVLRENNDAQIRDYSATLDYDLGDTENARTSRSRLTGLFDYTTAERGAPGAVTIDYRGASSFLARQYDEDLFSALKYQADWDTTASIVSSISYQTQYETYRDPVVSIDDHYLNRIIGANLNGSVWIAENFKGFAGLDLSRSYLYSNENYITSGDSLIARNRAGAFAAVQTFVVRNLDLVGSIRMESISDLREQILPQVSAVWHFLPNLQLGGAWSESYHAPTLNELYWKIGGNPNLQEELGKNLTGYLRCDLPLQSDLRGSLTATYFRADLTNEIIWQPGAQSFFTPTNILTAQNQGVEIQGDVNWRMSDRLGLEITEDYTFLSALDKTAIPEFFDKEIPYSTPTASVFKAELQDYLLGSLGIVAQYRGHRYTDLGNTESGKLPPETTLDLVLSASPIALPDDLWIVLQLACRNLTNVEYVEEPNFPLPGRNVRLNVSLRFHSL